MPRWWECTYAGEPAVAPQRNGDSFVVRTLIPTAPRARLTAPAAATSPGRSARTARPVVKPAG
jgi:hypothetical protein